MFKSNRIVPSSQKKKMKRIFGILDPTHIDTVCKSAVIDDLFSIIFIVALVGYAMLGVAAGFYGNPQYIIYEQNSTGGFCGIGSNVAKPSVFYFDVLKCASAVNVTAATFKGLQCPTTQVCLKDCPSAFWFLSPEAFAAGAKPSDFFQQEFCDPSLDLALTTFTVQQILDKELCPAYYTPSKPVKGKCLPSFNPHSVPSNFTVPGSVVVDPVNNILRATRTLSSGFNAKSMKVRLIEDLTYSWYWMLIFLLIALVFSMVLILLMQGCVSAMVVILITGILSVGAYGIYLSCKYQAFMDSLLKLGDLSLQSKLFDYLQVRDVLLLCLMLVYWLESIMCILFVACSGKGLNTALALMRECSKAMRVMVSTMIYPLVTFLLVTLFMSLSIFTSINMATSGFPIYKKVALNSSNINCHAITGQDKCFPKTFRASEYPMCPVHCLFVQYYEESGFFQTHEPYLHIYNFLMCLWCLHFIITLGQCTLAKTFSTYWSLSKPQNFSQSTVLKVFFNMIRYHIGSMAFGAVFVNMFQGIRFVLEYLEDVTDGGRRCCCVWFPMKLILNVCFYVLDKVMKYFNRNTYIMMAIYGDKYFMAAKKTCMLRKRNKDRVVVVERITDFLMFFGRLLVVGTIGVLAFCFFTGDQLPVDVFQAEFLNFCWLPIIVLMVGSYFIAQGCFSVYSMGVDTFTLCVMDDLERSDTAESLNVKEHDADLTTAERIHCLITIKQTTE